MKVSCRLILVALVVLGGVLITPKSTLAEPEQQQERCQNLLSGMEFACLVDDDPIGCGSYRSAAYNNCFRNNIAPYRCSNIISFAKIACDKRARLEMWCGKARQLMPKYCR